MKVLIVTANNGFPYVEVCMSSIHKNNFISLLYFTRSQKASSYHSLNDAIQSIHQQPDQRPA
jgi:hypothetical protein